MSEGIWGEQVAARYDEHSASMFAPEVLGPTVDFLARRAGDGSALELAIGTGRVAVPLLQRGVPVTGIELSEPMVARLRAKVDEAALPVVVGDMATARAGRDHTLVYLVFNTITNLLTQDAQVACFRNAARHLRPGGCLVVETFVPALRRLPPGQTSVPFDVSEEHLGFDLYDVVDQRLVSHHYWEEDGVISRSASPFRYVWPAELDLMARIAGLELQERFADWDGSPFTHESTSHVSVWRRSPG